MLALKGRRNKARNINGKPASPRSSCLDMKGYEYDEGSLDLEKQRL
jgi:hypothetical protein